MKFPNNVLMKTTSRENIKINLPMQTPTTIVSFNILEQNKKVIRLVQQLEMSFLITTTILQLPSEDGKQAGVEIY